MKNTRKITTFTLALIMPISLISGYFCLAMPQITQAAETPTSMPGCGEMTQTEHYMVPGNVSGGAIALCCLAKNDQTDIGVLVLNSWPLDTLSVSQSAPVTVDDATSGGQLILENLSIPSPQTELLSSVIKIE